MAKQKERNNTEGFKATIRSLKKEIKILRKQLHKNQNNYDDNIKDDLTDDLDSPKLQKCNNCGKGILNEITIANRLIYTCTICDFRSKSIKINKDKS